MQGKAWSREGEGEGEGAAGPGILPGVVGAIDLNSIHQVTNHLLAAGDLAGAPLKVFFPNGSALVFRRGGSEARHEKSEQHEANASSDGSLVLVKTHKTGTETMKSVLLDVASMNGCVWQTA